MSKIFLFMTICLIATTLSSHITNCKTESKIKDRDCCTVCNTGFLLNRCICYDEKTSNKFFLQMDHHLYMFLFILLPLVLVGLGFYKYKSDAIAKEEADIKTVRLGSPVEFDEANLYELRDERVGTGSGKESDAPEIEMGGTNGDLDTSLAENAE
jgi:hypothetical protein